MRITPLLRSRYPASSGFSLMEMAIVLMILGTLMSGVLVAVTQTTESNRRSSALSQLRQLEQALYGYAQTQGHLPCPATASSNGEEARNPGTEACTRWYGFIPGKTLGFYGSVNADGLLLDPWQNPVRYAVARSSDGNPNDYVFVEADVLQDFYNSGAAMDSSTMLRICQEDACSNIIAEDIPALILSMGADWANCSSDNEIENSCEATTGGYSVPNDNDFVMTQYAEDQFDDQMVWLSPYILFNKLISAGKLP